MKVLLDMNLSRAWLPLLREAGHEVLHWTDCGPPDASDLQIMAFARSGGWVILTHDLDFGTLLAAEPVRSPSVIQLRSDNLTPQVAGPIVLKTLLFAQRELEAGALITADVKRVRLRILPVGPDRI